jgi:tetratricopeptide (TPR) repeat protein
MSENKSAKGQLAPLIPTTKPPLSKTPSPSYRLRKPIEVALLNLSGLGLGYLYLGTWIRWLFYLLISIGIIVTAFVTDAHRLPVLWGFIFFFWPVWMSFDGWWLAKRRIQRSPDKTVEWKQKTLIAGGGVLAVMLTMLIGYFLLGQYEFKQGMSAYEGNKYIDAKHHFNQMTEIFELSLNPSIYTADNKIEECDILISGEKAQEERKFQEAIGIYESYLSDYVDAPTVTTSYVNERTAQAYNDWATQLRSGGYYEQAIEKYQTIYSKYKSTPIGTQIDSSVAEAYVEWGTKYKQDERYQDAIEKYKNLEEYPNTQPAQQMDVFIADTYLLWAQKLNADQDFENAISKYQIIIDQYSQTPSREQATNEIVSTYAEWATNLRTNNDFHKAIQTFQIILSKYPKTAAGEKAKEEIAQSYLDWGAYLIKTGDFFGAMDKFEDAKKTIEDSQIALKADKGHEDALIALSQDTAGQGKQVLSEALKEVCAGSAATSPAIGLGINESGKALFCGSESSIPMTLPANIKAVRPEHFLYALNFSSGESIVQSCPYTSGYRLVRNRYWWKIEIYSTLTGKLVGSKTFSGSTPDSCPYTYTFIRGINTSYLYGGQPSESEIIAWLEKSFK